MKKFILLVSILALMLGLFAVEVVIGDGTTFNGQYEAPTPYGNYYANHRVQYLVTAAELNYAGGGAGDISSLAFNVQSLNAVDPKPLNIKLAHTTLSVLTSTFVTGLTQVYSVDPYTPALGWDAHEFDTPFNWNGADNLVVEVFFGDVAGGWSSNASVYYTGIPNMTNFYQSDGTDANTVTTGSLSPNRANMKFDMAGLVTTVPPGPATALSPADGATYVLTSTSLNWSRGGGNAAPTGYKLSFGTDNPPTNIENNTEMGNFTTYNPGGLAASTTYYWQVVPYNTYGDASDCPVWSFTTGGAPLRGEKTIDPAGSGADNFVSFTEAITALNGAGVGQDGVIFNVPAGLTFNEASAIPAINVTGTLENPITFVKSGTGDNPVVTIPGTTGATDFVFKLNGVSYITFDGIDVSNAADMTNLEYGYWLVNHTVNGGSSNNVIKNSVITLNKVNSNTTGVYALASNSQNNNNLYQNLTVNNAKNGVWLKGTASIVDENNVIQGCVFNGIGETSMKIDYQTGMNIFDNLVSYPMSNDNLASQINGVYSNLLSNSSIYNNTFSGGNVSKSVYGMFFGEPGELEIHHNTFSGVVSSGRGFTGIWVNMASFGNVHIHHNDMHDISGGWMFTGLYTYRGYDLNINDNHIYNIYPEWYFYGVHALEGNSLDSPANIYNNKIHSIQVTGDAIEGISGINTRDRYSNIYNNMVWDITSPNSNYAGGGGPQIMGISVKDLVDDRPERSYIYNNTVYLDATGTDNSTTSCFYSSFAGPVDLKNNIFVNNSTPGVNGKAVVIWKTTATFDNFVATMNNNIYYAGTPGPQHLIYHDPTQSAQTLAEYKALNVGKDQNSFTENVPFVSSVEPYDLHIDPTVPTYVEGNGIPLPTVLIDDIDGDIRDASTPDIGADEGDFTPYTGGVTLTAPANVSIVLAGADVEISWDAVDGATGYYVYGSDLPYAVAPWGTPLATVNAPDTTTTLSPSSQFKFYYVTAFE